MKLIAHRGNVEGPKPIEENRPEYIDKAIEMGYNVEIDIRYEDDLFYLGHDESQYVVNWSWLVKNRDYLWIHCKNLQSLYEFSHGTSGFNYFWHQEDDFVLTSEKYIWTYPGKSYTPRSVIVMPEWEISIENLSSIKEYNCYGVCSDYVGRLI